MSSNRRSVCSLAKFDPPHSSYRQWQLECRQISTIGHLQHRQPQVDAWHCHSHQMRHPSREWGALFRGHQVSVKNDLTHHLLQERRIDKLRSATLIKVVLGLLNSGAGGRVFMGLSECGVVNGIRLTLQQRDTCMLGVSRCMRQDIIPNLAPCDQLVEFLPVKQAADEDSHDSDDDNESARDARDQANYYVVIITVRPAPGQLYRSSNCSGAAVVVREACSNVPMVGPRLTAQLQQQAALAARVRRQVAIEKHNLSLLV